MFLGNLIIHFGCIEKCEIFLLLFIWHGWVCFDEIIL